MLRLLGGIALALATASIARAETEDPKALFERATVQFRLGQFHEAARTYERVYELRPDPVLLYNCAQSYRLANEPEKALVLYKSFLAAKADAPNRREVEVRIAELERLVTEQRKAKERPPNEVTAPPAPVTEAHPAVAAPESPAPAVAPAPAPATVDNKGRVKRIAGIAVLGVGVAALVGGIVAAVFSERASDSINAAAKAGDAFDPSKEAEGKTDTIVSGVMFGVGGAAVVTGGVLLVLGLREGKVHESKVSFVPMLSPTSMGAAASVRF